MEKDQYLLHDVTARHNQNIIMLLKTYKVAGYGMYWMLLEHLRMQRNYRGSLKTLDVLAGQMGVNPERLKKVITDFGLFEVENDEFFSPGLCKRMARLDEKRAKLSANGRKGARANKLKASIPYSSQAEAVEESRAEESRVLFTPPKTVEVNQPVAATTTTTTAAASTEVNEPVAAKESHSVAASIAAAPTKASHPAGTSTVAAAMRVNHSTPLQPYRGWEHYIDALAKEQIWLEIIAIHSGMKERFFNDLPLILKFFKTHVQSLGKESHIMDLSDAKSYLYNILTPGNTAHAKLLAYLDRQQPVDVYRFEQRNAKGGRSYCGVPIPSYAPPRPNDHSDWDDEQKEWC